MSQYTVTLHQQCRQGIDRNRNTCVWDFSRVSASMLSSTIDLRGEVNGDVGNGRKDCCSSVHASSTDRLFVTDYYRIIVTCIPQNLEICGLLRGRVIMSADA